ncbi:uncharacterized protein LOC144991864 [Oryzias latipes]
MDSYVRGLLWATLLFSIFPLFYCSAPCPSSCQCNPHGEVICVGYTITEIPKHLPVHTYTLKLNDTNMNVIKEHSLAHQDLLLRFSLTQSHLHTIHAQAFHAAPQLKSVKLSSNDLSTLPARVFSPLTTVEEIYLDGNQLETLAPEMFEGLSALLILDLTRNKLTGPGAGVFDGLTNLTVLNLGRNNIKKFPKNIFHSLTKLRRLRVYNNELESLEEGIFDQLTSLEELILHGNKIEGIAPQVFWSLGKLKILTLSGNQLQTVPHKSFYNMPELSKLTIYKNPLLFLPNELMGHMPDMREFYLFSTNLTTVPGNVFANMSGLLRLNLHLNNKLRHLPPDVFCCLPNLQKLSLRNNNLFYLPPQIFSSLTTVNTLLLNDNNLTLLPEDVFQNLTNVMAIDLKNNNLKSLPGDIFSSNAALRMLNLSKNPWDCNCAIRDFARWIRNNPRIVIDIDDVLCHSPIYHVLRRVNSLRDDEFTYCDEKRIQTSLYEPAKTTHVSITTEEVRRYPTPRMRLHKSLQPLHVIPTTPLSKSTASEAKTQLASLPPASTSPTILLDILLIEQVPEYVHHYHHRGWVYVWFLPSDTDLLGFLMFCYILLLAAGLLIILAAVYGMHRLSVAMEALKAGCA